MNSPQKIMVLVPDGVGLRNFVYSDFYEVAKTAGIDVLFWNDTAFDLKTVGYPEVRTKGGIHLKTHLLKTLRIEFDLTANRERSGDAIYDKYRFPFSYRNVKQILKSLWMRTYLQLHSAKKGSAKVRTLIKQYERKTPYYRECLELLEREKPDLIFCTNQRIVRAIAPILAAQDLGVPTSTFIFSWDNLPKATMALEPDWYLVWSNHMKDELLSYHPYIGPGQVLVTGTPQFVPHYQQGRLQPRAEFLSALGLDPGRRYICFSGDDVTTSPNDAQYLSDTADAVRRLNQNGHDLGLIFRRCPVDFSDRYDDVLARNRDVITPADPKWQQAGETWNTVLPTSEDLDFQLNTIAHTEMVINLGSSMVFDYAAFGKPCAYINYDVVNTLRKGWSVKTIYNFVHFRSMPAKNAVLWIDGPQELDAVILKGLQDPAETVAAAREWFKKINAQPADLASQRIIDAFKTILAAK